MLLSLSHKLVTRIKLLSSKLFLFTFYKCKCYNIDIIYIHIYRGGGERVYVDFMGWATN